MIDNKREQWLDNLKLIACVAVFWGHFYSSFFGQLDDASVLSETGGTLIFIVQHILNICFNGSWWVYVFCIISGWLAWKKEINSFRDLIKALIHRYLRFVIPVFCANLFVVIIDKTVGFHAFEVGNTIHNQWLSANYSSPLLVPRVFISALLLNNEFIGPLWVLPYIFIGTCLVYLLKYFAKKCHISNDNATMVLIAGWMAFYFVSYNYSTSWFFVAVTVGGVLLTSPMRTDYVDKKRDLITGIGLVGIALSLDVWTFDNLWNFVTAWLFVWFSFRCGAWRNILENKGLNRIGHLSFTLYMLHCPILYSLSMLIYQWLTGVGASYTVTAVINLLLSSLIVLLVCEGYYLLVQKRLDRLVKKI